MIYLKLFWEFLKIGMFSFGGAYGAIPVIHDAVIKQSWLNEEMFENLVAISESTPGPIMVNMATFVGSKLAGPIGAMFATLGVVLPSFVIILLISIFLRRWLNSRRVKAVLSGIRPAVAGIILATGIWMAVSLIIPKTASEYDIRLIIIFALLIGLEILWNAIRKNAVNPILLIIISAIMGIIIFA